MKALEQAEFERERTATWLEQHGWWPLPSGESPEFDPGDYSFMMTDEQYANQERVRWMQGRLKACLQTKKYLGARDIYAMKPTAITLEWGELETEVEIEISRYGNLAAVFVHGNVALTLEAQHDIEDCLEKCGLLRITDEEVDELQEQGLHYLIF